MLRIDHTTWLRPDGTFGHGTLFVSGEGLRLFSPQTTPPACDTILDGRGHWVVPGLVDPHTHLREPGQAYKEGITNGTRAALAGGVTTILDMPNDRPPTSTCARLDVKRARFSQKSRVHWGLHIQASASQGLDDLTRVASVKVYMARSSTDTAIHELSKLREIFAHAPRVAIHAEDESRFPIEPTGPHHERRPREAIRSAHKKIEAALTSLPEKKRPRLILCHVSTRDDLTWLAQMKRRGFDIWGEAAPHYAIFTHDDVARYPSLLQVNPPIRSADDRAAILAALAEGPLDFAATDHAPHTPEEKSSPHPPSGIAGIEAFGPWLFSLARAKAISWSRFLELGARNAARAYDLCVAPGIVDGAAEDLTLFRRGTPDRVVTKARFTPYQDHPFAYVVAATIVGGHLTYHEGTFPGPPQGREVY